MKKALVLLAGVCFLAGSVTAVQAAQGDLADMLVALHLQTQAGKNQCTAGVAGTGFGCDYPNGSNLVTTGNTGVSYDMYIVLLDIPANVGIQGIELGLDFDGTDNSGLDMFGTTALCADQEFSGDWPEDPENGAATYTWLACQDTPDGADPQGDVSAVAAVLYAYAWTPDTACIDIKPSGVYGATDCEAASSDLTTKYPDNSGCVGFGGQLGSDPCLAVPVLETTWGNIKRQFK